MVAGIGVRYPGHWELGSGKVCTKISQCMNSQTSEGSRVLLPEDKFQERRRSLRGPHVPLSTLISSSINCKLTLLKMQTFIRAHKGLITLAHPSEQPHLHKTISESRTVSATHREQRFPLTSHKSVPINSTPSTHWALKSSRCLVWLPCHSNTILFTYYVFRNVRNLSYCVTDTQVSFSTSVN